MVVGKSVGTLLGAVVGFPVGTLLGAVVGFTEATLLGAVVGFFEATLLGARDGFSEGTSLGAVDNFFDGLSLGNVEGFSIGKSLGAADGSTGMIKEGEDEVELALSGIEVGSTESLALGSSLLLVVITDGATDGMLKSSSPGKKSRIVFRFFFP